MDLSDLHWHRLRFSLINTRRTSGANVRAYARIEALIQTITNKVQESAPEQSLTGRVFFHLTNRKYSFKPRPSEKIEVEVLFVRHDSAFSQRWKDYLVKFLPANTDFSLASANAVEERSYELLRSEFEITKEEGEICLDFLTPVPFTRQTNAARTFLTRDAFIGLLTRRFSKLFGDQFDYSLQQDAFASLPYYWHYVQIDHNSVSQKGEVQHIKGCAGKLYVKGRFSGFLPHLILASELHAGLELSYGQGYYRLLFDSPPHFSHFFPVAGAVTALTREVLERYDHAAESLAGEAGLPFDERAFAENLTKTLADGSYVPAPSTAFTIKKKSGEERLVEQPSYRDLIVQEYLLRTLSDVVDSMFEAESIGFRKGVSRQRAVEMVHEAVNQGYRFVIESDIEDFFASVDLKELTRLIEFYLPEKDSLLKELLNKLLHEGYVHNGVYHPRTTGLAQGSPLSPLLANLYLDSFDEAVASWGVKLIRYADDFVILTKTEEEAHAILSQAESYLTTIGLKLKKEKTCVVSIRQGFQFLGMQFTGDETQTSGEEDLKLLKKPLYITEPFLFVGVNGDAVEIRRNKEIIETIPLRRISEILLMEKAAFSTSLVKKCSDFAIPLTIILGSGYHVTTIVPESKKYFDVAYDHARKYASLDETTVLSIAKEFAATKVDNYIALFRQRYTAGLSAFLHDLEETVREIYGAATLPAVRGFEGAAARQVYKELNTLIDNKAFHLKKRDRKEPDRINSLLNFAYYLLFARLNATVRAVGLNPYLGFLHSPDDPYESLVSDLVELFRARADRFIVRLLNLKVIQETDFVQNGRAFYLQREACKKFLDAFEGELEKKSSDERLSLAETMYVQVQVLHQWVSHNHALTFYRWDVKQDKHTSEE